MQYRKSVLIIDAHDDVLLLFENLLENEGFDTATAWSAKDALNLLAARRFDALLVSDFVPDIACGDLIGAMRRASEGAPIVVMHSTARSLSECEELCQLGVYDVIRKRDQRDIVACLRAATGSEEYVANSGPDRVASCA